jgi:hypothetical protein
MPIVYVVLYALVALFFFFMGKITTEPEDRDAFLATLASLLWPLAMIVVLISVIYSRSQNENQNRFRRANVDAPMVRQTAGTAASHAALKSRP